MPVLLAANDARHLAEDGFALRTTDEVRVCLRDGTRPIHTEREGIAVLGMILAAYEGARTGTIAPVLTAEQAVSA